MLSSRKDGSGDEWAAQVYDRLLEGGIIFLSGAIDEGQANLVVARLLYLDRQGPSAGVSIHINSHGGEPNAALTIYDTMQLVNRDIRTVCVGVADGVAALILAAGTKGKRFAYSHARIRVASRHEGTLHGTTAEIDVRARQLLNSVNKSMRWWRDIQGNRLSESSEMRTVGGGSPHSKHETTG